VLDSDEDVRIFTIWRRILFFAEARGYLTDEDIFRDVS